MSAASERCRQLHLDVGDFEKILDAMAMDLTVNRYGTYGDLCGYMEGPEPGA